MKNVFVFLLLLVFADCVYARDGKEVNELLKKTFYYQSLWRLYVGNYEIRTDSIALVQIPDKNVVISKDTIRMAYYGPKEESKFYKRILKGESIRKAYIDFPVYLAHPLIYRDSVCFAKFDLEECYIKSFSRGNEWGPIDTFELSKTKIRLTKDLILNQCNIVETRFNKMIVDKNMKMIYCTFGTLIGVGYIDGIGKLVIYDPEWTKLENLMGEEKHTTGIILKNIKINTCELSVSSSGNVDIFNVNSIYFYLSFGNLREKKRTGLLSEEMPETGNHYLFPAVVDIYCDSNFVIDGNIEVVEFKNIQVGYQLELHSSFELSDSARKSLAGFIQELKINKELRVVAPYGRTYAGSLFRPDQQMFIQPIYYNQSDEPSWINSEKFMNQRRGLSLAIRPELLQYSSINALGLRDEILAVESRKDLLQNERDNVSQRFLFFLEEVVRDSLSKKRKI